MTKDQNSTSAMTSMPLRRILRTLAAATAFAVLAPGAAHASTLTVDDDKAQCPSAGFTDLQAAINQAAPWDTVRICDGTYTGVTNALTSANSPAQAGSRNGFLITKPLTLKGAGASKVMIKPAASAAPSLAGTAPYLRDGGGAVIAINRQSLGSSDFTENFVDISGVTVASPDGVYAEAGIQFFNTSGKVSSSVVGPLYRSADAAELATKPYGYGVVMSNSLQGVGETTVRREVSVVDSTVTGYQTGGILFDDARGADGAASTLTRSGILGYGFVSGSKIIGAGPSTVIPQTGVQYHAGQRGSVVGSTISGNTYTPDARRSVGLLLTDAETGVDPSNPPVRAFFARGNSITGNGYGAFNADIANSGVRMGAPASLTDGTAAGENWFGCPSGPVIGAPSTGTCDGVSGFDAAFNASVIVGTPRAAAPAAAPGAGPVADAPPTGSIIDPGEGDSAPPAAATTITVAAADDLGVKSVAVKVNGTTIGTDTTAPYSVDWTPTYAMIGQTFDVTAVITDSSDATTTTAVRHLLVPVPAGYVALTATPASYDFGSVYVGSSAHKLFTLTNTGQNPVALGAASLAASGEYTITTGAGAGTCTATTVLAVGASCTIDVAFAPLDDPVELGTLSVPYTAPGGVSPLTIVLKAKGPTSTSLPETVSGTVSSTLGLTLSSATSSLGSLIPGVTQDYLSTLTVGVTTTGADSALVLSDPDTAHTGHLVNGAYTLAQALQAGASNAAHPSTVFGPVGSSVAPLTLVSYPTPISNDAVAVTFKQPVADTEPLRTGAYAKTLRFTLSTTTP